MINLKIARIKNGMDQKELAKIIGCTFVDISRYETGKVNPPINKLCKLADALNVSTDYLLGREDK